MSARAATRYLRRGVTLIEVLIVLALVALFTTITVVGFYGTSSARLRQGTVRVAGVVRVAYAYATSSSKVVRLVFDFGAGTITMEETRDRHLLKHDPLGGDAANEAEAEALEAADAAKVRTPPSMFTPVDPRVASGIKPDEEQDPDDFSIHLPSGIQLWQVDVEHQDEPIREGKAYVYFFPGGQTENAAIQLRVAGTEEDSKTGFMTILVSPLTGKTNIVAGRQYAPKPRDENEASELEDPGR